MSSLSELLDVARQAGRIRVDLAGRLETLKQERDALQIAPLPKADMLAAITAYIDAQGATLRANLEAMLKVLAPRPDLDLASLQHGPPLLRQMHGAGGVSEQLVLALVADVAKQRLGEIFATIEWPASGPPLAQRPAQLAKLNREIAKVEGELGELNQAAAAVKGEL